MSEDEQIKDIIEILELSKEDIKNNNENITAVLDLQDLKSLQGLLDLYNKEKEKNKVLEAKRIWNKGIIEELKKELEQEKEKNKELNEKLKMMSIAMLTKGTYPETEKGANDFDNYFISKDKIRKRMEQTKKVYDEEMKPYMIDFENGEKSLNVTYLSKKEKEKLINKRNCLLTQIKTYEMLLED